MVVRQSGVYFCPETGTYMSGRDVLTRYSDSSAMENAGVREVFENEVPVDVDGSPMRVVRFEEAWGPDCDVPNM